VRSDTGQLEPLPADASPFRRYEVRPGAAGWHYLLHAEGALDHETIGRTRSASFAARAADVLNRSNPRTVRSPHGPVKTGWF
jgi:hypothetical protein